jgi:hypothetical protein
MIKRKILMENLSKDVHLNEINPYTPPTASLEMPGNGGLMTNGEKLNPWFSMWVKPRATIQQIIDGNPERFVLILAAIAGFSETLDRSSWQSLGDKMELPMILAMAAVAGPFFGIVKLYMGGALLRWTGGWLGGKASPQHIRAAMAWSNVPVIWAMILWIPLLALFGSELFTTETPGLDANEYLMYALIALGVIGFGVGVWAFAVFLKCLGQVQGFSAWKALGNTLLALLIIVVPVAALIFAL